MESLLPPPGGDLDRGPELLAVIWTFTSLASIAVLLKIYARLRIIKAEGLDDVFIFFSAVSTFLAYYSIILIFLSQILVLICSALFTYDIHLKMGRHVYYLDPRQAIRAVKINYIANPFGIMAYSFPNISVAIFIDQILVLDRARQITLHGIAGTQVVIAAISCVLLFVQCSPAESLWNPSVKPKHCLSTQTLTAYSYFVGGM